METKQYIDKHTDLVKRCQQGERKAQYELYKQYSRAMFNVCIRILNDHAEAEDALQEAFIAAFSNLHKFKGESTFGAWLKQIVVNQAVGQLRNKKFQFVEINEVAGDEEDSKYVPSEWQESEIDEGNISIEIVQKSMEKLSEGYRVVLSLYLFEGYDHEEIGQILNISESTSRTQYMRAKKRLLENIKYQ